MTDFRRRVIAAAAAAARFLSGCASGIPIVSEVSGSQGYSDAQIRLVVATERNRYRNVYTDEIWQVAVDDEGTTFEAYLMEQIRDFLKKLKTMNLMADERDIRVSGQDKERLQELSQTYYDSLTEEDRAYIGAGIEDIYELYEEYHRANCLVDELTKDVNLEISDSEAKVINVQEIRVSDADYAQQVYDSAMSGTDFLYLAKAVSEDEEIEKTVGRRERTQAYEDVVFALGIGEVSPVIEEGGSCYIVRCVNDYNEEATLERKEKLAVQRKTQAFDKLYEPFAAEHTVELRGDIWRELTLLQGAESTTTTFFELYQETMR